MKLIECIEGAHVCLEQMMYKCHKGKFAVQNREKLAVAKGSRGIVDILVSCQQIYASPTCTS